MMNIEYMAPADLIPYSKNAKRHPSEQVKLIANSIKQFGFQQPIVVDKDNIVVIGHGRLLASKRLKLEKVPGGYRYGSSGKIYKKKADAERQGRAIKASQARHKKKKRG